LDKLEKLSLDELKRENAEEETKEQEATAAPEAETEKVEASEVETEAVEVEAEESGEPAEESQEEAGEAETEAWMQSDDQTSQDEQAVPVGAHAKMRAKLKGKVKERDKEIEALRQEIEALKGGDSTSVTARKTPPRPKLEDFGYDQDAYDKAVDDWYDQKIDAKLTTTQQAKVQKEQIREQEQAVNRSVDQHYERASELVEKNGIDPELYKQTDLTVRQMIENIFPKQGDAITDKIISVLDEGSEKVMYFLGRNAAAQNEVSTLLRSDPSGLKASAWLGRKLAELTMPKRSRSNAPKPAKTVQGDAVAGSSERALKKKYDEAHNSKNGQAAYNAKKQAKAKGIDVSNW
jgi:hypothetical protein